MTREDIYDHLAQVYLGKRNKAEEKKKKQFNAWLVINVVTTGIIFASAFYGLTAFLAKRASNLENNIIFSLHNGPLQLEYNFENALHPVKFLSLSIPPMNVSKYTKLQFSIRSREEGNPGIMKLVLKNRKNETAYTYIRGVNLAWKEFNIPLSDFTQITDWSNLDDLSFVLETWNVDKKKGMVLIDDVRFSNAN